MSLKYDGKLIPFAKRLRKEATKQENHLWYDYLRTYKVRFQRQKVIDGYIADFYCHEARLVIEIDGHSILRRLEWRRTHTEQKCWKGTA